MLVRRELHLELEIMKWLAILALAVSIAIMLTGRATGEVATMPEPDPLPASIDEWSKPMNPVTDTQPATTVDMPGGIERTVDDGIDATMQIWQALAHQQDGELQKAIDIWEKAKLPPASEVWRHIAIGAAHLQMVEMDEAAKELFAARSADSENAVVHYYIGMLRLVQAEWADQPFDAGGPAPTRLIAYPDPAFHPNTEELYKMAAVAHLERAVELAPYVEPLQPLVPVQWGVPQPYELAMPVVPPTVGDLLTSIGADRFEAKAHNVLSYLYLERGLLEEAEQHMDDAARGGLSNVNVYSDLGAKYEQEGRHTDAARAYAKQMAHGRGLSLPAQRMIENLRKAVIEIW